MEYSKKNVPLTPDRPQNTTNTHPCTRCLFGYAPERNENMFAIPDPQKSITTHSGIDFLLTHPQLTLSLSLSRSLEIQKPVADITNRHT